MVSFNEVPQNVRVPFVGIEFDNSNATQGPAAQEHTVLIIGQKLSTGSQAELELVPVVNEADARDKFGAGSMLHHMVKSFREVDTLTSLKCVAIDDLLAGVANITTLTFPAQAITKDGIFALYLGGRVYKVGITAGMTNLEVGAAVVTAINDDELRVVNAAGGLTADIVELTARHKGLVGNEIDIRFNHYSSDKFPTGFVVPVIAEDTAGAGNPDVQEFVDMLPDEQFNYVVNPYTDAANLTVLATEAESRNTALRQIESMIVSASRDSFANQTTLGESRNDRFLTIMDALGPDLTYRWAAAYAARLAQAAQIDPARPFQTLTMSNLVPPKSSETRSFTEKNLLLYSGISVAGVSTSGVVSIGRAITTYRLNVQGGADASYLDVNTYATLSYIRYDFRTSFQNKYPRHKLADDGNVYESGQPIMTPKVGRGFAVSKFEGWGLLGLVENIEQFIAALIVVRNAQDVNRLDFQLAPDLINQLRVAGVKIAFLL